MSVVSEGTLGRQAACFHVECVLPPEGQQTWLSYSPDTNRVKTVLHHVCY